MRYTAATVGLTAALLVGPAAPALADTHPQQAAVSVAAAPQAPDNENNDDGGGGGWGLWGLLGLLGLAGMIPRKSKTPDNRPPDRGTRGPGSTDAGGRP